MFRAKVTIAFFITVTSGGEEETPPQLGVFFNENAFLRGGINEEIKQITQ